MEGGEGGGEGFIRTGGGYLLESGAQVLKAWGLRDALFRTPEMTIAVDRWSRCRGVAVCAAGLVPVGLLSRHCRGLSYGSSTSVLPGAKRRAPCDTPASMGSGKARSSVLAHDPTGPPLRDAKTVLDHVDRSASLRWA